MQIHNIKSQTQFKQARRIGRGGKRGTTSGRGTKGLGARAGGKYRPAEREILKKMPKLRGYKFKSFWVQPAVVNLAIIEEKFKSGDTVSPETLLKAGLISKIKGKTPKVKILGQGELKKKLNFKDVIFSKSVQAKLGLKT